MKGSIVIQGRQIGQPELELVRNLLAQHSDWHRTGLSRELCRRWAWRNAAGQSQDMACRSLLLKLEKAGLIRLPPRRGPSVNERRHRSVPIVPHRQETIAEPLRQLLPLEIGVVASAGEDAALFRCLIAQHHYLGVRSAAGENLKYLVRDRRGRLLGCLWFAGAAWRCKARDRFIGWDDQARRRNLPCLANNTRFLVLPWVRVDNLASHLLSRLAGRISRDWHEKYGHGLHALETFVDRSRFTGACYRAANWLRVGQSTGRTRNDVVNRGPLSSIKDVYVYPPSSDIVKPPKGTGKNPKGRKARKRGGQHGHPRHERQAFGPEEVTVRHPEYTLALDPAVWEPLEQWETHHQIELKEDPLDVHEYRARLYRNRITGEINSSRSSGPRRRVRDLKTCVIASR